MPINRHNYESFFLMYADNELTALQRSSVEEFVGQNPDLKAELLLIMDTVLPAEVICFQGKHDLLKTFVDDSLQEKLLLHMDNELTVEENADIEMLIQANEKIATEWNILKTTKLDAGESIVFENKSILYRKEKDNVVLMTFVKYAVAAALIGMGLYVGISLRQHNKTIIPAEVAAKKPVVNEKAANENGSLVKENNQPLAKTKQDNISEADNRNNSKSLMPKIEDKIIEDKKVDKNLGHTPLVSTPEKNLASNNLPRQQNKIPEQQINIKEEQIASLVAKEKPAPIVDVQDNTISPLRVNNNNARIVMLDANDANADNRILFIEEDKVTRSKAAGFLRKLKRTVERNTKIVTGEEIKIAGFSFAVK